MLFYLWLCSKTSESVCSLWFLRRICLKESFHVSQCYNIWLVHIWSHAKSSLFSRLCVKFFCTFVVNCFCQSYSLSIIFHTQLSTLDHHVSKKLYIYLVWVLFATKNLSMLSFKFLSSLKCFLLQNVCDLTSCLNDLQSSFTFLLFSH
jgi:hypothetical protein